MIHLHCYTLLRISPNYDNDDISIFLSDIVLHERRKNCAHLWTRSRISNPKSEFYTKDLLLLIIAVNMKISNGDRTNKGSLKDRLVSFHSHKFLVSVTKLLGGNDNVYLMR